MDIHARVSEHPAAFAEQTIEPAPEFDVAILWLRRDLRLDDNPALVAASRQARRVVPLFIYAPDEEGEFKPGKCSRWWLKDSLAALDADLYAVGSRLIKRSGLETLPILLQVLAETKASAVFFNNLYDPISLVRDQEVKEEMAARGVVCQTYNSELLYEPWEILDGKDAPFSTFEGFWNRVTTMPYPPQPSLVPPQSIPPVPAAVISATDRELAVMSEDEEMLSDTFSRWWTPGSAAGMERAVKFMQEGLRDFDKDRSKTDRESTSKLSPHIHFGEISTRRIYWAVKQYEWKWANEGDNRSSCADFLRQLGYREYGRYLSYHFPLTHEKPLLVHLRACPWNLDQSLFKAWRQGATGYPLVDAGMLELWSNGWIHNRLRVVCSSFLVKNMLLPWQWGLKHFWDCLLDADLECDALGFQYVAGCLLDAHPFGFMHDIAEESRRFDPDGTYVRKWLPSLTRMPTKYIHNPSAAPASVLAEAGVDLGTNYPFPIVSPEESQQRLSYACDVIARCCPDSPKHGVEPYYPPSDPALDPDAARGSQPYRNPSQGDNVPTQTHCSELRPAESDVASNDISGCGGRQSMAQGGNGLQDIVEQGAEDDEGETTSQQNETATSSQDKRHRRPNQHVRADGSCKTGKRGTTASAADTDGGTDGGTASGVDVVDTGSPSEKHARHSFEARRDRRRSY